MTKRKQKEKAPALLVAEAPSADCAGGAAIADIKRQPSRKGNRNFRLASEHYLYVTYIGQEITYPEKPDNSPTLHIWVDDSDRQWTATYHHLINWHCSDNGTFRLVHPAGQGWVQWEGEPPAFMELRTHRPSSVWWRKTPPVAEARL